MSSCKKNMRKKFISILQNIKPQISSQIHPKLISLIPNNTHTVLSFAKLKSQNEIDLTSLNILLAKKLLLVLPRVNTSTQSLDLYRVSDINTLIISDYGIPEPNPDICIPINPDNIDIVLVPGLAFDYQMNRLGRGKGFYDKLLTQIKGNKIGVCFREQISNDILPTNNWDQKVDQLCFI